MSGRLRRLAFALSVQAICLLRRRPLIIVHMQEPGLREHVEPVIAWLLEHARVGIVVLVPPEKVAAYRHITSLPFGSGHLWLAGEAEFSDSLWRPRVLLSLHPETPSAIGAQLATTGCWRVVMQHGLSDKAVFGDEETPDLFANTDVICLAGPVFREGSLRQYAQRCAASYRRLRFLETGLPKTDVFFRPSDERAQVLAGMGLDSARKTVCYAPTFQKTASLQTNGVEIMHALASLDVNVIVKLHHWSLKDPAQDPWAAKETDGRDWKQILRSLEVKYSNLRLADEGDAAPYLMASDLLVSDASGVAYEFLLLDRPIVFFDVPALFVEFGTDGIHYWGRECGEIVQDVNQLADVVERAVASPGLKSTQRADLRARLLYAAGRSTEATGRALLTLAFEVGRLPS